MLKPVTDFIRKHIDAPFLVMARAAMAFCWKTFAVVPPALQHVVMAAAGGIGVIASGAFAVSAGEPGFSSFLLLAGVVYGGLGVWLYLLASRKPWNAATYKQAVASALEDRQGRLRTRVSGLFIGILMCVASFSLAKSGQTGEAKLPLLMALLFLTMTLSEYCRAAEPPNPDDGDTFARTAPSRS
ncbi:hypothetical protein [Rhizobium sp. BK176]|uniref:hypothetical protein n=1 Tax=Rhizobium sp. BK176 TaxID=2587071 RepID=UPI00216805F7|nr:hypothetical protein [Rhizobium sp. BK176]MCS4089398.1 hypothetical protein [Rhizobium sp. BK176]